MSTYKIQYGSEKMPQTISEQVPKSVPEQVPEPVPEQVPEPVSEPVPEPIQYIPNVYKDAENNMIMYVRMTDNQIFHDYIGSGLVINTHKGFLLDNHFVLGTSGLNGCVALAINIDHLGKQMVWLSHISSDIHEKNLTIILKLILIKINMALQIDEANAITWDMFDGTHNTINLAYNRRPDQLQSAKTAVAANGDRIELDKLIKTKLDTLNAEYNDCHGNNACYFSVKKIDPRVARKFNKDKNGILISFQRDWPFHTHISE